jgi:2-polyprenyl-3-methyl-5-hydroxy-6-metoxy-1,4-benzoquinol methylase
MGPKTEMKGQKKKLVKHSSSGHKNLPESRAQSVRDFNRRIQNGEIQLEATACLCGSRDSEPLSSVDRYGFLQDSVLCKRCGLISLNPRLTEAEYAKFYSSDLYRKCYEGENYVEEYKKRKYRPETGQAIFDEIVKFKPSLKNLSIIEIGAGGGWNLLPFLNTGANVTGLDYSPSLVELGREYGINMQQGGIQAIQGQYDVIILNHVLEHFLDPIASLKSIMAHLKDGGIFYIAVPNILNFGMGQLQNAHVWYFSPKTFVHYCGVAGLKMMASGRAAKYHMFGVFEKGPVARQQADDLKGHYQDMRKIIKKVEAKAFVKKLLSRFGLPVKE